MRAPALSRFRLTAYFAAGIAAAWFATAAVADPLRITQISPPRNSAASPSTSVVVDFDKPVNPASVHAGTFRVFGRASGAKSGSLTFSNGDRRVTFQPVEPFAAGEAVRVNLSHAITAADLTTLRGAGYFFQFMVRTLPGGTFQQIDILSNRVNNLQTRIYGAAATDLNNDGYTDLATVNEVSFDVRVCLSRADGSGLYYPFLAPQAIGEESSPNDVADFNGDGNTDLCIAATVSGSVAVLLGTGNGTFAAMQEHPVGDTPHGVVTLDVDGDGDADIVNANQLTDDLSLLINDGSGAFGAATFFDGGVDGEYGLAAADMNNDGIGDLVVGGNTSEDLRVLLGNGDGTFTPAGAAQSCGGLVWVVIVDDVNGDGNLDVSTANSTSNNAAILLGSGTGSLGAPMLVSAGAHTPSTDFGDLDGDGDADLILSVFGGGYWRRFVNDGAGNFTFVEDIPAPSNPSCAVLYDSDNDGDLDMALTDEIADVIVLMRNSGTAGIEPGSSPPALALLSNRPNPFRNETILRFSVPVRTNVRLEVFDVGGRRVGGFGPTWREAGWQEVRFDGRDHNGRPLPTGVYAYRLTVGAESLNGRMVVTR